VKRLGYIALFVASIAGIAWLNQPFPGLPTQDPLRLITDPWAQFLFAYFSFLIMPVVVLLIIDAYRRNTRWGWLAPIYMALGIAPLSLYLAMRPRDETRSEPRWVTNIASRRWFWLACLAGLVLSAALLIPRGSAAGFIDAMNHNFGWWFMPPDILLNQLFCLPLLKADMDRRGVTSQRAWLFAVALTGPVAINLYMARRGTQDAG
jgi:hypothetical protein